MLPSVKAWIRKVRTTRSVGQTLAGIGPYWRTKIRSAYR